MQPKNSGEMGGPWWFYSVGWWWCEQEGDNWALGNWRSQDQHIPETTMSSGWTPLVCRWGGPWDGGALPLSLPAGVATHHTVPSCPVKKRWAGRENGDLHALLGKAWMRL